MMPLCLYFNKFLPQPMQNVLSPNSSSQSSKRNMGKDFQRQKRTHLDRLNRDEKKTMQFQTIVGNMVLPSITNANSLKKITNEGKSRKKKCRTKGNIYILNGKRKQKKININEVSSNKLKQNRNNEQAKTKWEYFRVLLLYLDTLNKKRIYSNSYFIQIIVNNFCAKSFRLLFVFCSVMWVLQAIISSQCPQNKKDQDYYSNCTHNPEYYLFQGFLLFGSSRTQPTYCETDRNRHIDNQEQQAYSLQAQKIACPAASLVLILHDQFLVVHDGLMVIFLDLNYSKSLPLCQYNTGYLKQCYLP